MDSDKIIELGQETTASGHVYPPIPSPLKDPRSDKTTASGHVFLPIPALLSEPRSGKTKNKKPPEGMPLAKNKKR